LVVVCMYSVMKICLVCISSDMRIINYLEEICAEPIQEYLSCLSTKDETRATCYNENLAVLRCTGNCPTEFDTSLLCLISGGDCTSLILQWVQCGREFCADTYLVPYGQCVAEQKKTTTSSRCSSCPTLVASSEATALLTLPPTCAVFEQDYCEWQTCCEPCQYYLNFYGRCMQVNFNSCQDFFKANPSLPTCPLQVTGATQPAGPDDTVPSDGGSGSPPTMPSSNNNDNPPSSSPPGGTTADATDANSPTSSASGFCFTWSWSLLLRMTWLLFLLFFMFLV